MNRHPELLAVVVALLLVTASARPDDVVAQAGAAPDQAPRESAPPTSEPPAQAPPPAPSQTPPPPAQEGRTTGAVPPGQWVYTQQYGWVWMPYASTYTYAPPDGYGTPYEYVYYPAYGWAWVVAPWVWGPPRQGGSNARARAPFRAGRAIARAEGTGPGRAPSAPTALR